MKIFAFGRKSEKDRSTSSASFASAEFWSIRVRAFYSGRKQKAVLQMSGINPIFAFVPNLRIKNRMGRQIRLFDMALFRIGRG